MQGGGRHPFRPLFHPVPDRVRKNVSESYISTLRGASNGVKKVQYFSQLHPEKCETKKRRLNFFFFSTFLKNRDEIKNSKTQTFQNFYLHVQWRKPHSLHFLHNAGTRTGTFFLCSKRCPYSDIPLTFSIPLFTTQERGVKAS